MQKASSNPSAIAAFLSGTFCEVLGVCIFRTLRMYILTYWHSYDLGILVRGVAIEVHLWGLATASGYKTFRPLQCMGQGLAPPEQCPANLSTDRPFPTSVGLLRQPPAASPPQLSRSCTARCRRLLLAYLPSFPLFFYGSHLHPGLKAFPAYSSSPSPSSPASILPINLLHF